MVQQPGGIVQSVYDLIRQQLGGARVTDVESPEITTVGLTSLVLFRLNAARLAFVVVNLSANVLFLRPGRPATTSAGIRLAPNGGSLVVAWNDDLLLPAREWQVISDAGAANVVYNLEILLA